MTRMTIQKDARWHLMFRPFLLVTLWLSGVLGTHAQTADVLWAVRAGGSEWDSGRQIAIDPVGNVVVAGKFQGTATFGETTLIGESAGNSFLAKYDAQGVLLWVHGITAPNTNFSSAGLAVDPAGNIYLSADTFVSLALHQALQVSKFDPEGRQLWTRSKPNMASPGTPVKLLALDGTGHIYLAGGGYVAGSIDSFRSLIVIKLDVDGNELWRRTSPVNPSASTVFPISLAADREGNCAVAGWFSSGLGPASLNFGSVVLKGGAYSDVFTAKYDSKGNLLWAASLGTESLAYGEGVAIDQSGAVYVTGDLGGEVNSGVQHFFVAKYDTAGKVVWLKQATGTGFSSGRDLILTRDGNLLVSGLLSAQSSMQLDSVEFTPGSRLVFLIGCDPTGVLTTATGLFHSDNGVLDGIAFLAADERGDIYYTDIFRGSLTLGSVVLSSAGDGDMLLAKISGASLRPNLQVSRSGDQLVLAWPATLSRFVLETTDALSSTASWLPVTLPPIIIGDQHVVTVDAVNGTKFFRLTQTRSPWETVDAFQLVSGLSALSGDIGTGADGTTLYSVGSAIHDGSGYLAAVVRKSADSGATWRTMDVYFDSNTNWVQSTYRGFGSGSDGTLFAAGELWDGIPNTGTKSWIVCQSSDGGSNWVTSDTFYQGVGAKPSCGDIKVSPAGDVYAAGVGNTGNSAGFLWAVRKRAAGGAAWQTVDMVGAAPINEARAIAFHPTAGVFVVGRLGNSSTYVWSVRRSENAGATWTTVDSFLDGPNTSAAAESIAINNSGAIYVAGRAQQYVSNRLVNNWVVRRSLDGGATWATVDKFGNSTTEFSATGMTIDPSGKIFVTGYTPAPSRFFTRKGTPGPNGAISWVTSDDFQLVQGQTARANGITSDMVGNIFATGRAAVDSTGLGYWLTRRLTP